MNPGFYRLVTLRVAVVLHRYEQYIQKLIRHEFYEVAEVASEMLRTAKAQEGSN